MRKRVIDDHSRVVGAAKDDWLDLERMAQIEVTSEDAGYPIESARLFSPQHAPAIKKKSRTQAPKIR